MEYRYLGHSGVRVSTVGLGTNRFGSEKLPLDAVPDVIDAALDLGINFLDSANTYQNGRSEEAVGRALKGRWDRFVVATKFDHKLGEGPNDRGASRYHMMHALEGSLRRLATDHVDLYYVHYWDPNTPVEETLRALDDAIIQGKIRYIGVSNVAAWQVAHANVLAEMSGWAPFIVVQNHYHMLQRDAEREMLPYCQAHDVGFIPYFPLAGGFLTGKYKRGEPAPPGSRGESSPYVQQYMTDANYTRVETLTAWAEERGHTMNELAIAWLLAQPQVCSVISGATKVEHVLANAKAAEWILTSEEAGEVRAVLEG